MPDLSLAAETLLLAVDPADGGPLLAKRRHLRKARRAAAKLDGRRGSPRRELLAAGLVEQTGLRRHLRLTDRLAPAQRFNAIKRGAATGDFDSERDQQLFVLLAGSGVLARRLNRDERRRARRRLSSLIPEPNAAMEGMAPGLVALAFLADAGLGDFGGADQGGAGDGGFDASLGEGSGQ